MYFPYLGDGGCLYPPSPRDLCHFVPEKFSQGKVKMKCRKFSIVVHNVNIQEEAYWNKVTNTLQASQVVNSIEEYPNSPGHHHLHCFVEFTNARSLQSILKLFDNFKNGHILPAPDESKTPGRIQVDPMKGSFQEATAYLTEGQSKKDKLFGNVNISRPNELTCSMCSRVQHKLFFYTFGSAHLCAKCHGVLTGGEWALTAPQISKLFSQEK
ncbi:Rep [Chicken proventriculitis-associated circular virus 1]|nr:Rep [Chicken proventriculitis-associated circular virus 1]